MRAFMKWASHSLVGHVVVFELGVGVPLILVALYGWFQEHSVSTGDLIRGTIIAVTCSGLGGVLFWFTLSRSLIQRKQGASRS